MVDANKIISKDQIIKHKETGSYALFSDIFRYELMRALLHKPISKGLFHNIIFK
ncbi:alpha (1-4)-galactosyltransferase domain protein [Acinetobacter baumannii 44362_9]|nr:alpha (1-4)-galactosyltransferase domain protein [Acinetobacter baumannii 1294217]EXD09181.1 alpha (1-4)-galactosyltransferase domain protein [Acinetobacter baumannii 1289546]EXD49243.1 alpha (1-4)-galactosyltransferase domain protein [Acinetobacter baumannii 662545-1347]EXG18385.1 alpha (1-4)-galactosyltransferase domain protein [Acinetobacter baumannii 470922]EXG19407.1 alpha (1-4)-galactosyltransferase domain protein [Acinetobacter baumannii 458282]EXG37165.1 alpha (1-4)-galactosyltransf